MVQPLSPTLSPKGVLGQSSNEFMIPSSSESSLIKVVDSSSKMVVEIEKVILSVPE